MHFWLKKYRKLPEQSSPVNPSLHLQVFPGNRVLTVVQFSCEGFQNSSDESKPSWFESYTVAINELLCLKNAGA